MRKKFKPDPSLRPMDRVRRVLGCHHYAYRTERTYCDWIARFMRFFDSQKHAKDMGKKGIECFLSHRALKEKAASVTQPQALNAIIFWLLFHNPIHNLLD